MPRRRASAKMAGGDGGAHRYSTTCAKARGLWSAGQAKGDPALDCLGIEPRLDVKAKAPSPLRSAGALQIGPDKMRPRRRGEPSVRALPVNESRPPKKLSIILATHNTRSSLL